jgi:hypothetical protein
MRDDIIAMAREAGWPSVALDNLPGTEDMHRLERFEALVAAAERNKLVAWMMAHGYTHDIERDKLNEWMGYTASQCDATKDLLTELGWQIAERIKGLMSDMECQAVDRVNAEREACAKVCDEFESDTDADAGTVLAAAIRARGQA